MAVTSYKARGRTLWRVDTWVEHAGGAKERVRQRRIPTREQAVLLERKLLVDAAEGRLFPARRAFHVTVEQVWKDYEPVALRNDSGGSDRGRAAHLRRHLGGRAVMSLTATDIETYRQRRGSELTRRGTPPSPTTLDLEVELLKRICNYAVTCQRVPSNPIAGVKLLRVPNARLRVCTEEELQRILAAADEPLASMVLVAHDTGMRKGEILALEQAWIDVAGGTISLPAAVTKTDRARTVYLTARAAAALARLPRPLHGGHLFINPATGKRYTDIRKAWLKACAKAGVRGVWFHDERRSFVTNARRAGISESVIMKMTGHTTRSAFARYNIVDDTDLRDAAARLDEIVADRQSL